MKNKHSTGMYESMVMVSSSKIDDHCLFPMGRLPALTLLPREIQEKQLTEDRCYVSRERDLAKKVMGLTYFLVLHPALCIRGSANFGHLPRLTPSQIGQALQSAGQRLLSFTWVFNSLLFMHVGTIVLVCIHKEPAEGIYGSQVGP